ncbi:ribosome hibernation-promoting factor, HPF/YfiA family [Alkalinema pantanalense CENA528]|uniref:ribosome hibernation-promoting factor, HPF/YfiA family n=1 Tax=Alkalinema pantanalense TaxID=1620705 RepID=UPI003D6FFD8A
MQIPLQIISRSFSVTPAIETAIQEKVEKLTQFFDRITNCRVTLESTAGRHQQGNLYQVRIDLSVPGKEIIVNRNSDANHSHEDLYVAIRDSFDAAKRQLQDYVALRQP